MTDTTTNGNGGKHFWADVSKKSSTWAAVAAAGAAACEFVNGDGFSGLGGEHALIGIGVAAARAVLGLVQGKTGDPATAKFDKANVSGS